MTELSALFPPNTAGNSMISEIPVFRRSAMVKDVKNHLIKRGTEYKTVNYLYLIDKNGILKGVASIKELLQADPESRMKELMIASLVTAAPLDPVPRVALLALQHNLKMVPIVDEKKRLIGAFGSDQLLDILNKEFADDLLRLSGIRVPRRHFKFKGLKIVYSRLPWMLVGMLGGLLTGFVIGLFKSSIEAIVLLAVFIPVIMSTGATSANQSAMIFLRNLMHGDIEHWIRYLYNEIKVSGALAIILGAILYGLLLIYPGEGVLAMAVSASLFVTIIAGSLIGVFIPMVLNKLKLDAALGAGPFLTIIKDLIAMSIYFSVATSFLKFFG